MNIQRAYLSSSSSLYCKPSINHYICVRAATPLSRTNYIGLGVRCGVRFRPCIDIHKGKVKQIVGSTLKDLNEDNSTLVTNFQSDKSAAEYANLYKEDGLTGGHVIMLGADPPSKFAAFEALHAYPDLSSAELTARIDVIQAACKLEVGSIQKMLSIT